MSYGVTAGTQGNFGGYQAIKFDEKQHVYHGDPNREKMEWQLVISLTLIITRK